MTHAPETLAKPDLGRALVGGELQFVGRVDRQVQIRGYRVEPAEVESVIADHPQVRQVVVEPVTDDGGVRLVAYVVPDGVVGVEDLREVAASGLPRYLVPSAFVFLDRLPLTAGGKVDRRALPVPEVAAVAAPSGVIPGAGGELERLLLAVWGEVLKLEQVTVDANFFDLGGDSLLMLKVLRRLEEHDVVVTVKMAHEHQTVRTLAGEVERMKQ